LHTSLTLPQVPDDYKIINVLWLSGRRTRKGWFGVVAFSYQVRVFWQLCHLCPLVSMSVAGSGKTAAFMVPILSQICVRGRELMSQNSVCDLTFLYLPTICWIFVTVFPKLSSYWQLLNRCHKKNQMPKNFFCRQLYRIFVISGCHCLTKSWVDSSTVFFIF